jgi:hypothetical protein
MCEITKHVHDRRHSYLNIFDPTEVYITLKKDHTLCYDPVFQWGRWWPLENLSNTHPNISIILVHTMSFLWDTMSKIPNPTMEPTKVNTT